MADKNTGKTPFDSVYTGNNTLNSLAAVGRTVRPTFIPEDSRPSFVALLNGVATNELSRVNTQAKPPEIKPISQEAFIQQGNVKVFISRYKELTGELKPSTHKLLDICTLALAKQNNYRGSGPLNTAVVVPLEEYLELCGKPVTASSKKEARKKIKEDLETLFHISLEWSEPSGKKTRDFAKMRICDSIGIKNGNIMLNFTAPMASYLNSSYIMQYSTQLLQVDERNANSYPLGKKLLQHNSMENNIKKGTANIISVKSALEACPDIPTYEEVMSKARQIDQKIKAPLERALNSLPFITWEYSNSKGKPLTEEQLGSTDYKSFEKLYIHFQILGAPDQSERLQKKADQTQKKKAAKKNNQQAAEQ